MRWLKAGREGAIQRGGYQITRPVGQRVGESSGQLYEFVKGRVPLAGAYSNPRVQEEVAGVVALCLSAPWPTRRWTFRPNAKKLVRDYLLTEPPYTAARRPTRC